MSLVLFTHLSKFKLVYRYMQMFLMKHFPTHFSYVVKRVWVQNFPTCANSSPFFKRRDKKLFAPIPFGSYEEDIWPNIGLHVVVLKIYNINLLYDTFCRNLINFIGYKQLALNNKVMLGLKNFFRLMIPVDFYKFTFVRIANYALYLSK